jgi:hypothetical protein
VTSTAAPHHGSEPGLGRVIAFRPRRATSLDSGTTQPAEVVDGLDIGDAVRPLITWATRAELVEHAAYRETPSGRTGWYLGEAHVPALSRLELGDSVLVFRSRGDGQLFTHSLFDTLRGVAFEDVE